MKATLLFDLPEDTERFALHHKVDDLNMFIHDLDDTLRAYLKYDNGEIFYQKVTTVEEAVEIIRDEIYNRGLYE